MKNKDQRFQKIASAFFISLAMTCEESQSSQCPVGYMTFEGNVKKNFWGCRIEK
jgi:hypothetical protein